MDTGTTNNCLSSPKKLVTKDFNKTNLTLVTEEEDEFECDEDDEFNEEEQEKGGAVQTNQKGVSIDGMIHQDDEDNEDAEEGDLEIEDEEEVNEEFDRISDRIDELLNITNELQQKMSTKYCSLDDSKQQKSVEDDFDECRSEMHPIGNDGKLNLGSMKKASNKWNIANLSDDDEEQGTVLLFSC